MIRRVRNEEHIEESPTCFARTKTLFTSDGIVLNAYVMSYVGLLCLWWANGCA